MLSRAYAVGEIVLTISKVSLLIRELESEISEIISPFNYLVADQTAYAQMYVQNSQVSSASKESQTVTYRSHARTLNESTGRPQLRRNLLKNQILTNSDESQL